METGIIRYLLIITFLKQTFGQGKISISLYRFKTNFCQGGSTCNYKFDMCYDAFGSTKTDCNGLKTGSLYSNHIEADHVFTEVKTTVLDFTKWTAGGVLLRAVIYNYADINNPKQLANMTYNLHKSLPIPSKTAIAQRETLVSGDHSLSIDFKVYCVADYYNDCSLRCTPENTCNGHYTCNQTTGARVCLDDWTGTSCKTPKKDFCPVSDKNVLDILFLLDGSGSVKIENWYRMLDFVGNLTRTLGISKNGNRVGVISYGNEAKLDIKLNQYHDINEFETNVKKITWKDENTNTTGALWLAKATGFTMENGHRSHAFRTVILITDGENTREKEHLSTHAAALQKIADVFVIAVTEKVNISQINMIASDPDSDHVFSLTNFEMFQSILNDLVNKTSVSSGSVMSSATPAPLPTGIEGTWIGTFICTKANYTYTLKITNTSAGISGDIAFRMGDQEAKARLSGLSVGSSFTLAPDDWVRQIKDWKMPSLTPLTLSADGQSIQGSVSNLDECTFTGARYTEQNGTTGYCNNGGTCFKSGQDYTCCCPQGYEGSRCENVTDACVSKPCQGRGTCSTANSTDGYVCDCDKGYAGKNCQYVLPDITCANQPCQNNASCSNHSTSGFVCTCVGGYTGDRCEKAPCAQYYYGEKCDVYCKPENSCAGHYNCDSKSGEKTCLPGYGGTDCKVPVVTPPRSECPNMQTCQNNGICMNGTCCCAPGYEGTNCQVETIECISNPCQNKGLCIDGINGYSCYCQGGYKGTHCEQFAVNCTADPCKNNATCVSTGPDSFNCTCKPGYSGIQCEDTMDPCLSKPCKNSANCTVVSPTEYSCQCPIGFKGPTCEEVDPCASDPCMDRGNCSTSNSTQGYVCDCKTGFAGGNCQFIVSNVTCADNPCQNNATCTNHSIDGFVCNCSDGYTGVQCEKPPCAENYFRENCTTYCKPENSCAGHYDCNGTTGEKVCLSGYGGTDCKVPGNTSLADCPGGKLCENNGVCFNGTCCCEPGFEGIDCGVNIKECSSNPCKNGATCKDMINSYECECKTGYKGVHCETYAVNCTADPCKNNATCTTTGPESFNCTCAEGYTGELCEEVIDPCLKMPCQNEGNCSSAGTPQYTCTCKEGYTGDNCETAITTTQPPTTVRITTTAEPCVAQDTCSGHYTCDNTTGAKICLQYWTGVNCDKRQYPSLIDPECPATPHSCRFNSSCFNGSCCCTPGYQGEYCNIDIDECLSAPCKNDAFCSNYGGTYECECKQGFSGKHCETNLLDDCANGVCLNGANCTNFNGTGNYACSCAPGFTGQNCETNVNECDSNPCQNGGTCVDNVNMYNCTCAEGFTGSNCNQTEMTTEISATTTVASEAQTGTSSETTTAATGTEPQATTVTATESQTITVTPVPQTTTATTEAPTTTVINIASTNEDSTTVVTTQTASTASAVTTKTPTSTDTTEVPTTTETMIVTTNEALTTETTQATESRETTEASITTMTTDSPPSTMVPAEDPTTKAEETQTTIAASTELPTESSINATEAITSEGTATPCPQGYTGVNCNDTTMQSTTMEPSTTEDLSTTMEPTTELPSTTQTTTIEPTTTETTIKKKKVPTATLR